MVAEISADGEWAFMEGSEEYGVAMSDLVVVDPPEDEVAEKTPMRRSTPAKSPFISFPLGRENVLELKLTKRISKRDFDRLKMLIELSEESLVDPEIE